jgi:hypothetical protein
MVELRPSDAQIPEPEVGRLEGCFSSAARQRILDYLQSFHSFEPRLVLLYGDAGGTEPGSWSLQAISSPMLLDLAHMYSGFGGVICFDLDGIQVVVPQLSRIDQLDKGILEFRGDRLFVVAVDRE